MKTGSISGAGRVPLGAVGALALIVAGEAVVAARRVDLTPPVAAGYRYAAGAVEGAAGDDVLCFGDSLVKFGVMPRLLDADRGRGAFNLASPGARPPLTYFLFRRALDAGARPSAVLVDYKATLLQDDPLTDAAELAEALTAREGLDLALATRDPVGLARVAVHRAIPSLGSRQVLRAYLAAAVGRRPWPHSRAKAREWQENWDANLGAWVVDKNAGRDHRAGLFADEANALSRGPWSPHPVNAGYVRRLLDDADHAGVPVYWLVPPISPRLQAECDRRGDDARYSAFVRATAGPYPSVTVIDSRRSGYPSAVFLDGTHLDVEGAFTYSAGLGAMLRARGLTPDGPRWVTTGPYRPSPDAHRLVGRSQAGGVASR